MNAETTTKPEAIATPAKQEPAEPVNPVAIKKAISLGREMGKQAEVTKADVARKMFELILGELDPHRQILQAVRRSPNVIRFPGDGISTRITRRTGFIHKTLIRLLKPDGSRGFDSHNPLQFLCRPEAELLALIDARRHMSKPRFSRHK